LSPHPANSDAPEDHWFDGNAEEAMHFYTSVFKNSRTGNVARYGEAGPGPKGSVMSVTFELDGQEFYALNGVPHFSFTPAVSFFVSCKTQAEVDYFWDKHRTADKDRDQGPEAGL
jgi:predicted 3-demethylubiquinone-9 3-methyltransferase (glyoxalase superfamily)